ncbi:hypothetical protein JCM9279_007681 [Rhodotorula babjevae]
MVDSAPSTPSGPRATPGGGRHLKRLSLSSSFSPNGHSPSAANGTATSPLSSRITPTGAHRGDSGVRALRTSLNGAFPPSSSPSARRLDSDPSSSNGPGTTSSSSAAGPLVDAHRLAGPGDDPRGSSPTILRRSTSYRTSSAADPGSATASPSALEGTASLGRSHGRRGASVSYTGRSSLDGLALSGVGGSSPARASLDGAPSAAEHSLSRSRGPSSSSLQGVSDAGPPASSSSASSSSGATAGPAVNEPSAQPTLVEQNADLLSFIAKKERKCLDLREELKRHESELAQLKKKWESIVARSLQQQHVQSHSPNPNSTSSTSAHPRNASTSSTISSAHSPNTSPTPRSHRTLHSTHSLDLSLLSSTFDGAAGGAVADAHLDPHHQAGGIDAPIEIPESVKAAGTWLGDALGRVLEAAVGMPPPTSEEADEPVQGLGIVEEEDEDEEGDAVAGGRAHEEEERQRRRESKASSVETDGTSSVAGAATTAAAGQSTAPSSLASDDVASTSTAASRGGTVEPASPTQQRSPMRTKPTPTRSTSPHTTRQHLFTPPSHAHGGASSSSPHSTSPSNTLSHSRSRSTALDALSGGWSSLNRKWTQLSESDTVRNTRKATLGLVDTFEQGLAQALGPLEPPPLSPHLAGPGPHGPPPPQQQHAQAQREGDRAASASAAPRSGLSPSSSSAAGPTSRDAAAARLPSAVAVPGQGLSSVFASFGGGRSPQLGASASASASGREGERAPQAQPSWDWSAFLPGSTSSEGLDQAAQHDGQGQRAGEARGKRMSVGSDGLSDWPGW